MDRRALFFLAAAVVSLLLAPLADPKFRWVAFAVAVTYAVLAVASALDARTKSRR